MFERETIPISKIPVFFHLRELRTPIFILQEFSVKPEVQFYSQLMRRRVQREDYPLAMAVTQDLHKQKITPSIQIYTSIARCCTNKNMARHLIADMEVNKVVLTIT